MIRNTPTECRNPAAACPSAPAACACECKNCHTPGYVCFAGGWTAYATAEFEKMMDAASALHSTARGYLALVDSRLTEARTRAFAASPTKKSAAMQDAEAAFEDLKATCAIVDRQFTEMRSGTWEMNRDAVVRARLYVRILREAVAMLEQATLSILALCREVSR